MVQSPSCAANWFAASQEIPRISRNPKVHYRTHKRPPPVSVLGQSSPVHIPTSHLLKTHPNIIHPSSPRSPSGFSTKTLYAPSPHPYALLIYLVNNILNDFFRLARTSSVYSCTKCRVFHNVTFFRSIKYHILHKYCAEI